MGVRRVLDKPRGSSPGALALVPMFLGLLGMARSEDVIKERMVREAS